MRLFYYAMILTHSGTQNLFSKTQKGDPLEVTRQNNRKKLTYTNPSGPREHQELTVLCHKTHHACTYQKTQKKKRNKIKNKHASSQIKKTKHG